MNREESDSIDQETDKQSGISKAFRKAKKFASNAKGFGLKRVGLKRGGSLEDIAKPERPAAVRQRSITEITDVKFRALHSELVTRLNNSDSIDSNQSTSTVSDE